MAMKINTLKYFLMDASKSFTRNKTITLASCATVATTLFIMGIFLLTLLNVNQGILGVQSNLQAEIYINDNITLDQQTALENAIRSTDGVKDIKFVSKEEALKKLRDTFGADNQELTEGMEQANPLPANYIVKVTSPDKISNVIKNVQGMPGIYQISDVRDLVNKVQKISNAVKYVGLGLFLLLSGVSLFLISNTIKLAVYARRREIGIMKFIGATDWFIRWPFIFEGMFMGVAGALMSLIVVFYTYRLVLAKFSTELLELMSVKLVPASYVFTHMSWEFLLAGIAIGVFGSIMAIRKFLKV